MTDAAANSVGPVTRLALAEALALEGQHLAQVAQGAPAAWALLWECERALVAPAAMRRLAGFDKACARARDCGWPVRLRATGGDVTPQGLGVINLSVVFPGAQQAGPPSINAVYRRLISPILAALKKIGVQGATTAVPGSFCDGAYNITISGRKFAGTAQRWRPMAQAPDHYAHLAHVLMLMHPPAGDTIDILNQFNRDCGLARNISAPVHIGLSELAARGTGDKVQRHFEGALQHIVNPGARRGHIPA